MSFFRYKRLWYWVAQFVVWVSFMLANTWFYSTMHPSRWLPDELEWVFSWVAGQALAGVLLTHLLRAVLVKSGALGAKLGQQLLTLLACKIALSLAYYGVVRVLDGWLDRPQHLGLTATTPAASAAAERANAKHVRSFDHDFWHGVSDGMADAASEDSAAVRPPGRQKQRLAKPESLEVAFGRSTWSHYTFVWLLGYFFIVIAERYVGAELRRARAETALARTRLDLLQQQINPHFLFNTLNSIRALALVDPHRTRTALTQLADLLRYSLRPESAPPVIPLGEELAAVRDYLALEQTRFGPERLRFEVQVPPELHGWLVPPAALLTLVENAVKHGIAAAPAGGLLTVHAAQNGPGLTLTVSQPGRLPAPGRPVAPGSGLGLANTHQRLRALYGETASVGLEETSPGTVTAVLRLPFARLAA